MRAAAGGPGRGGAAVLRTSLAVAATLAAIAVAGWAAVVGGPDGHFAFGMVGLSAGATALLQRPAAVVPHAYALGAGMVAAINPCGSALLPAYLGLYLGSSRRDRSLGWAMATAVKVSLSVAATFVVLFGLIGLAVGAVGAAITGLFPWAGLLIGVMLIVGGGWMLAGRGGEAHLGPAVRLADRLGPTAGTRGLTGYFAYGFAYALASLGCTLPIFLSVMGSALATRGWFAGLLQFILYGTGMSAMLAVLTVAAAALKTGFLVRARRLGEALTPISAVVLLLVGAYLVYYWLTIGGILAA